MSSKSIGRGFYFILGCSKLKKALLLSHNNKLDNLPNHKFSWVHQRAESAGLPIVSSRGRYRCCRRETNSGPCSPAGKRGQTGHGLLRPTGEKNSAKCLDISKCECKLFWEYRIIIATDTGEDYT